MCSGAITSKKNIPVKKEDMTWDQLVIPVHVIPSVQCLVLEERDFHATIWKKESIHKWSSMRNMIIVTKDVNLYSCIYMYVAGQNEIQVKMIFFCLLTLIIHGS